MTGSRRFEREKMCFSYSTLDEVKKCALRAANPITTSRNPCGRSLEK